MSNRIKKLRKEQNIRQQTLADLVNCSQQTISKIENDKMIGSVDLIIDIAKALNTSVEYLMCQDQNYQSNQYNDRLLKMANQHLELLNILKLLKDEDIDCIYLLAHSLVYKNENHLNFYHSDEE